MEALYWPLELYYFHYVNDKIDNFADDTVEYTQGGLWRGEGRKKFLYWPGDPPFDGFEVSAYFREEEARRLDEIAIMLEQQGNFSCAANRWEEAENAWERVVEAWQAIPGHPEREKRISAARAKLAEAKERKEAALWKSAWWDGVRTSGGEVSIRYSSWPDRFKAKIVDTKATFWPALTSQAERALSLGVKVLRPGFTSSRLKQKG